MAETVQDPTQVTPSKEELQTAIDSVATDAALTDPSIPIERKLKSGQIFKGIPRDVIAQMEQSIESGSALIKQQRDELERIRQEQVQRVETTPTKDDEYSTEQYYKFFAEDPRKAQEYIDRFDPEKQELKNTLQNLRRQSQIDQFKGAVGFAPTAEEAAMFGEEFANSRLEPTANNFELVFRRMVDAGKLRPSLSAVSGQRQPPPSLGGGSAQPTSGGIELADFERLPADQQLQVIEKLKAQGWK